MGIQLVEIEMCEKERMDFISQPFVLGLAIVKIQ